MRGMPNWQPARLKQVRLVRGLSQAALAAKMDRSPASVSKWEKEIDGQSPDESTFLRLADVLKVRTTFLTRPTIDHGESPFFFRELSSNWRSVADREQIRLRWTQDIGVAVQEFVDLPPVQVANFLDGRTFLEIDGNDVEDIATKVRQSWEFGEGPIADVILAMENAGIVVAFDVVGSTKMDGLCNWSASDQRPYVLIAEDKYSACRSRMDAAHELGHIFLHAGVSAEDQKKHHKLIEEQAWRFASAFLMPARTFSADVHSISLNGFLAIKERWKVAISAMIMRCAQLDIIDKEQKSRLFKNMNIRQWRKHEPLDDELGIERPRMLKRAIELIISSGTRSKRDFIDFDVGLAPEDVEQLANLPSGYFEESDTFRNLSLKSQDSGAEIISFADRRIRK